MCHGWSLPFLSQETRARAKHRNNDGIESHLLSTGFATRSQRRLAFCGGVHVRRPRPALDTLGQAPAPEAPQCGGQTRAGRRQGRSAPACARDPRSRTAQPPPPIRPWRQRGARPRPQPPPPRPPPSSCGPDKSSFGVALRWRWFTKRTFYGTGICQRLVQVHGSPARVVYPEVASSIRTTLSQERNNCRQGLYNYQLR